MNLYIKQNRKGMDFKMKDPYIYEETGTLINKLGIKDYEELRQAEADITFAKLLTAEKDIKFSSFDLQYLKNIHKYILEDIFEWAGEFRTVPMEKPEVILGGDTIRYAYPKEIEPKTKEYIEKLNNIDWEKKNTEEKALEFTKNLAGLWQVHPFRDGNTRTTMVYAFKFAKEHGFAMNEDIILKHFGYVRNAFVKASDGQYAEYKFLNNIIRDSIKIGKKEEREEDR